MGNRLNRPDISCSVCHRPVEGNLDEEKIITCGRCVQVLLTASEKNKIQYRDKLKERGDLEGAKSIESFIIEEDGNGMIATPSQHLPSNRLKSTFKTVQTLFKIGGNETVWRKRG